MDRSFVDQLAHSIEFFLNPKVFGNPELTNLITGHLVKGDLVVIRNAMQEPFAERVFACLDQFSDWRVYERHDKHHFHYHHHNIYDEALFPPELKSCQAIFRNDSTKQFMQRLSQRDCAGETSFSASLYLPGDHSLPHNDLVSEGDSRRHVAFVWHLTKQWRVDWGGDLFWCSKGRYVSPSFNTLVLFNVGIDSMHFVTQVSPYAQSKRLAVNGWWTGKIDLEDELRRVHPSVEKEIPGIEII